MTHHAASPSREAAAHRSTDGRAAPSPPPAVIDRRPWGHFELLALNSLVSVKIICVEPGQRLSLQLHASRDEWWTVLDDGLYVEVGDERSTTQRGDRVWIPRGTPHRAGTSGGSPARFLEVAFGHFDEADIERLHDDYERIPRQVRCVEEPGRPAHSL
jgi:mannose-6-phosphate isomerase